MRLLVSGKSVSFGDWGVAMAIYLTAGVSGVHLNPAVTIALWLFACSRSAKLFLLSFQSRGAFRRCGFSLRALLQFIFRLRQTITSFAALKVLIRPALSSLTQSSYQFCAGFRS
ncbi:aquaporin [Escherichia coli]